MRACLSLTSGLFVPLFCFLSVIRCQNQEILKLLYIIMPSTVLRPKLYDLPYEEDGAMI